MESEKQSLLEPDHWVKRYADAMLNFAFRRTNDLALSEDLVQDTFLSALKARYTFKGNSQEKTWLYSILENKINDYFRSSNYAFQKQKVAIDAEFFDHFFEKENQGGHWQNEQKPKEWSNLAEESNLDDSEEFIQILQDCLKKLPKKLERIFVLKNIEEFDTEKICKELAITASNYWVMIHRAKLQLRDFYGLSKRISISFVIFLVLTYYCISSLYQLIANSVKNRHLILPFSYFSLIVIPQLSL